MPEFPSWRVLVVQLQTSYSIQLKKKRIVKASTLYWPSWLMIFRSSVWLLKRGVEREGCSCLIWLGPIGRRSEALFGSLVSSSRQPPPRAQKRYNAGEEAQSESEWHNEANTKAFPEMQISSQQLICAADQITSKHSRVKCKNRFIKLRNFYNLMSVSPQRRLACILIFSHEIY